MVRTRDHEPVAQVCKRRAVYERLLIHTENIKISGIDPHSTIDPIKSKLRHNYITILERVLGHSFTQWKHLPTHFRIRIRIYWSRK